jgi:hypothetical protein
VGWWYGGTELRHPRGFGEWKAELSSRLDARFSDFVGGPVNSSFRLVEVFWGRVYLDGIPALDDPAMIAADLPGYLSHGDPVFGIARKLHALWFRNSL